MRSRSVAEAKRDFSNILRSAERGEPTLIFRHGKPVAVLSSYHDEPHNALPVPREPGGLLSLVGLFDDWETMSEDMADIVAGRQQTVDRPPLNLNS